MKKITMEFKFSLVEIFFSIFLKNYFIWKTI